MRNQLSLAAGLLLAMIPAAAQAPASRIPRMPDGKPNLNGIWQTMNTANWDLQTHGPASAPVVAMGAQAATPPGLGVVEGNEIPVDGFRPILELRDTQYLPGLKYARGRG